MKREEAKQMIYDKSKSNESQYPNYIHLLVLHSILDKIFDDFDVAIQVKDEEISKLKAELNKKLINGLRMTKKDAKKLFKKTSDSACYYYDSIRVVSLGQVDTILDKIFEESEKQLEDKVLDKEQL
jgi:hypothetical protein